MRTKRFKPERYQRPPHPDAYIPQSISTTVIKASQICLVKRRWISTHHIPSNRHASHAASKMTLPCFPVIRAHAILLAQSYDVARAIHYFTVWLIIIYVYLSSSNNQTPDVCKLETRQGDFVMPHTCYNPIVKEARNKYQVPMIDHSWGGLNGTRPHIYIPVEWRARNLFTTHIRRMCGVFHRSQTSLYFLTLFLRSFRFRWKRWAGRDAWGYVTYGVWRCSVPCLHIWGVITYII